VVMVSVVEVMVFLVVMVSIVVQTVWVMVLLMSVMVYGVGRDDICSRGWDVGLGNGGGVCCSGFDNGDGGCDGFVVMFLVSVW
jgi:hypothetical protein